MKSQQTTPIVQSSNEQKKSPNKRRQGKVVIDADGVDSSDAKKNDKRKNNQKNQSAASKNNSSGKMANSLQDMVQKGKAESAALLNNAQLNKKEFRLFFGLIETSEDAKCPAYGLERQRNLLDQQKSGGKSKEDAAALETRQLKQWFNNLTIDERVNALTTTSPYLANVLINMKIQINKLGPTQFAKHLLASQSAQELEQRSNAKQVAASSYHQYLLREQAVQQLYNTGLGMQPALAFNQSVFQPAVTYAGSGYGQQYFMGRNHVIYPHQMGNKFGAGFGGHMHDQLDFEAPVERNAEERQGAMIGSSSDTSSMHMQFEDEFYSRAQCKNELEMLKADDPKRQEAFDTLCLNVKLTDLFMYLDTITISPQLVSDAENFFDVMERATNGNAFSLPCKFQGEHKQDSNSSSGQHAVKLHNIQIETPKWFDAQRFHDVATWIAVILEENLWANFNYWKLCCQKVHLKSIFNAATTTQVNNNTGNNGKHGAHLGQHTLHAIQGLFEQRDIQEQLSLNVQSVKVHTLAASWISASKLQRAELFDDLRALIVDRVTQQGFGNSAEVSALGSSNSSTVYLLNTIDGQRQAAAQLPQLHLFNQRFDSHYQALVLKKDDLQAIEDLAFPSVDTSVAKGEDARNSAAVKFILHLLQSSFDRVETGNDFLCRVLLKLIQKMHTDQVIQELLSHGEHEAGEVSLGGANIAGDDTASTTTGAASQSTTAKKKKRRSKNNANQNNNTEEKVREEEQSLSATPSKKKEQSTASVETASLSSHKTNRARNNNEPIKVSKDEHDKGNSSKQAEIERVTRNSVEGDQQKVGDQDSIEQTQAKGNNQKSKMADNIQLQQTKMQNKRQLKQNTAGAGMSGKKASNTRLEQQDEAELVAKSVSVVGEDDEQDDDVCREGGLLSQPPEEEDAEEECKQHEQMSRQEDDHDKGNHAGDSGSSTQRQDEDMRKAVSSQYVTDMFARLEGEQQAASNSSPASQKPSTEETQPKKKQKKKNKKAGQGQITQQQQSFKSSVVSLNVDVVENAASDPAQKPAQNTSDNDNEEVTSEKGRAVDSSGACADIIRSPETMAKLEAIAAEQELQASSSLSPVKSANMTGAKDGVQIYSSTANKPKHAKAGSMIILPQTDDLISDKTHEMKKKATAGATNDNDSTVMKKRKRKKKGPADPQEAMNAFIRDQFQQGVKKQQEMQAQQQKRREKQHRTSGTGHVPGVKTQHVSRKNSKQRMRRDDEISALSVTDKMASSEADVVSHQNMMMQNKEDDSALTGRRYPAAQPKKKRRDHPLAQSAQVTPAHTQEREEELKERERLKQERTRKEIAAAFGVYTGLLGVDSQEANQGSSKKNTSEDTLQSKGSSANKRRNDQLSNKTANASSGNQVKSRGAVVDEFDAPVIKRLKAQTGEAYQIDDGHQVQLNDGSMQGHGATSMYFSMQQQQSPQAQHQGGKFNVNSQEFRYQHPPPPVQQQLAPTINNSMSQPKLPSLQTSPQANVGEFIVTSHRRRRPFENFQSLPSGPMDIDTRMQSMAPEQAESMPQHRQDDDYVQSSGPANVRYFNQPPQPMTPQHQPNQFNFMPAAVADDRSTQMQPMYQSQQAQVPAIQQTFNNIYLNTQNYGQAVIGQGLLQQSSEPTVMQSQDLNQAPVNITQDFFQQQFGRMMQPAQQQFGNYQQPLVLQKHHTSPPAAPNKAQHRFYNNYNYNQQQNFEHNLKQTIEFKFYEKFDNDIYDEVNKIQRDLDLAKDERNYVLSKLQDMCVQVFQSMNEQQKTGSPSMKNKKSGVPKIKQFGSLVTGLALESSDMDMAVTNLYLPDREKMIESLELFADKMRQWPMIEDLKDIPTATIPVIKATVDLNKLRNTEMMQIDSRNIETNARDFGQTQTSTGSGSQQNKTDRAPIPESISMLKIDITFDDSMEDVGSDDEQGTPDVGAAYDFNATGGFTPPHYYLARQSPSHNDQFAYTFGANIVEQKTHLGIASCRLIKYYVETYKCLKEVAIVLKLFLARYNLNSPYMGGLSSYSTVLLLVAYMNKWDMRMNPTLTPSRLLMGFLDYFSYFFNVQLFGIDVSNNGSFFKHSSPETNLVILDPLNTSNNTAKNSFMTHDIIKAYRSAFNALKNLLLQYQGQLNANIEHNLLDVMLDRNQDSIPVDLAQQDDGKNIDVSAAVSEEEKREMQAAEKPIDKSEEQQKNTQETQTEEPSLFVASMPDLKNVKSFSANDNVKKQQASNIGHLQEAVGSKQYSSRNNNSGKKKQQQLSYAEAIAKDFASALQFEQEQRELQAAALQKSHNKAKKDAA